MVSSFCAERFCTDLVQGQTAVAALAEPVWLSDRFGQCSVGTEIAQGQLQQAEAYLVEAVAAGLIAREAATRLQEKIAERKQQQNSAPDRRVSPRNLEDFEIEETERRTCATEMPDYPVCRELPDGYSFHSPRQALEAMKHRSRYWTALQRSHERETRRFNHLLPLLRRR
jgi:hypothetical protein